LAKWSSWWILAFCAAWFALRLSLGTRFTRENASFTYNSMACSIVSLASFALLSYLVTHSDSILAKVFSWRWLTFTGSISYGLYLYQLIKRGLVSSGFGLNLR
jgi:peptidoglycan/LPS O-acetylase OafA/YrhL